MAIKKTFEIRAVDARSGQRIFASVKAVSAKQARFFFCKIHNNWAFWDWDIRECPGEFEQLSLFGGNVA